MSKETRLPQITLYALSCLHKLGHTGRKLAFKCKALPEIELMTLIIVISIEKKPRTGLNSYYFE